MRLCKYLVPQYDFTTLTWLVVAKGTQEPVSGAWPKPDNKTPLSSVAILLPHPAS